MNAELVEAFRRRLSRGSAVGPFAKTSDPAFVEVMGRVGFDFVILDLEHGPNGIKTTEHLIRAAEISGLIPIVRVKEDRLTSIGEALDVGAAGIQAPQVTSAEAAREVVKHARFAPAGERGVCRFVRAAGYSTIERDRYFTQANRALIIVQLEGTEALNRLDEILDVPEIDVVFIGPYDLSQSLGKPGQVDDPEVVSAMSRVVERCSQRGICVGTFVDTEENLRRWHEAGVRYLSYSVDVGLFADACRHVVRSFAGLEEKGRAPDA